MNTPNIVENRVLRLVSSNGVPLSPEPPFSPLVTSPAPAFPPAGLSLERPPMTPAERRAWLRRRDRRVGGSDAPIVMGSSPWSSPFELWGQKTGRLRPPPPNEYMLRGIELEPVARRAYEAEFGIPMPADEFDHPEVPFIGANFDGINRDARVVLEIKCPGKKDHAEALKGKIPKHYVWQCVHLMFVADLPELHYWSFDGWQGVRVVMKRDRRLERELVREEKAFWKCVTRDVPPGFQKIKRSNR